MIILFDGVRMSIPNWKPSPNRALIEFSRIAFPIIVLPRNDRADFAHDFGHLCFGGSIQISRHSHLELDLLFHLLCHFLFSFLSSSLFFFIFFFVGSV